MKCVVFFQHLLALETPQDPGEIGALWRTNDLSNLHGNYSAFMCVLPHVNYFVPVSTDLR